MYLQIPHNHTAPLGTVLLIDGYIAAQRKTKGKSGSLTANHSGSSHSIPNPHDKLVGKVNSTVPTLYVT